MSKILYDSLKAGVVTNKFPEDVEEPSEGFRGRPAIDFQTCHTCDICSSACPTEALAVTTKSSNNKILTLDYGLCIFCGECESACPTSIKLTKEFQLATTNRSTLLTGAHYKADKSGTFHFTQLVSETPSSNIPIEKIGLAVREKIHRLFNRSLHIREVDAGSCNGCEIEITALNNPIYDLERFGLHFVASPRHADMLLVTGPVTRNMEIALKQTYEATPDPKLVLASGTCAISGGIFGRSYASCGGVDRVFPVDEYIPGCPPRPEALLHGILVALDRLEEKRK
jgi:Ni,Fe-hydrogenase III small subunit/formate hydrogenlyase subunit 6/NADH:ubiquinone oxidoreductase subunit I